MLAAISVWLFAAPSGASAATCDFTFDGGGGTGNWYTGTNWNPDASVGPGSGVEPGVTACIPAGFAVTLDDISDLASIEVDAGASLTVLPGADLNANPTAGNVALIEGDVTIDAGDSGSASMTNTGPLLYDAGSLTLAGGGTFTNTGTGTVTMSGGVDVLHSGIALGKMTNAGTLTVDAGSGDGITTFDPPYENDSLTNVAAGTLQLNQSGAHTGEFDVAGTLDLAAGTQTFSSPIFKQLDTASLVVSGADATADGDVDIPNVTVASGSLALNGTNVTPSTLEVDGGTLDYNSVNPLFPTSIVQKDGIFGGTGAITLGGGASFDWGKGTLGGTGSMTIAGDGILNLTPGIGDSVRGMDAYSLDSGSFLATPALDNGSLDMSNAAKLTIEPGTEFDLVGDRGIGGTGTIQNSGTLKESGGSGANTVIGPDLNNDGLVQLNSNVLELRGGGVENGSFDFCAAGTGLEINNGTPMFTATSSLDDCFNGAPLTVIGVSSQTDFAGTFQMGDVTIQDGEVGWSGGSPQMNSLAVSGGSVTVDADTSTQSLIQGGGSLAGAGTLTTNDFDWSGGMQSGSGTTLVQFGTLQLSGTGDRFLGRALDDETSSYTQFRAGTLDLFSGATLTVGPSAYLDIQGNLDITSSGGTILVHGQLQKTSGSGVSHIAPLLGNPDGTVYVGIGTLTFDQDPLNFSNGTFSGGNWNIYGTLSWPSASIQSLDGNAHVQLQSGGALKDSNNGSNALAALTSTAVGSTLELSQDLQLTGPLANDGQLTINSGATLGVGGDFTQTDPGAVTTVSGTLAALDNNVFVNGGVLEGTGTVSVGQQLVNNAQVHPGSSPGTLTVSGDYTQGPSGVLTEEIAGTAAGQFDKLVVTGTATLDGTLAIQNVSGFDPALGQSFDYITAGTLTGVFATVNRPGTGLWYSPSYDATTARLGVNAISVGDATMAEGLSGSSDMTFTITQAVAQSVAASVDWATADGTAAAGSDYTTASGTVTFDPGQTSKTVTVKITGDSVVEPDEKFTLNLSNPTGNRIGDGTAVGTITNDDQPAPETTPEPVATPAVQQPQPPVVPKDDIDGLATAPPPEQGKQVNVEPVGGTVLVQLPGTTKFVPLPDRERIPVGSIVDATNGVVRLLSVGAGGQLQSANFFEGVFKVIQKPGQALTELKLVGGSFKSCKAAKSGRGAVAARKANSVRHLWGQGSGAFRTSGRFAAATVRGTKWLTEDRCDGTLVRVPQGSVTVRDLTLRKTVIVKAPKKYLAPAVKPKKG